MFKFEHYGMGKKSICSMLLFLVALLISIPTLTIASITLFDDAKVFKIIQLRKEKFNYFIKKFKNIQELTFNSTKIGYFLISLHLVFDLK